MEGSGRQAKVTPTAYEDIAADHFRRQGYSVELTPRTNDYGVDAFAYKENQKLALQAKMYGGTTRRVNRAMVMQLHGAKDYFECTGAVIVTDGDVADDARKVAAKLQIKILPLLAESLPSSSAKALDSKTQFEEVRAPYPAFADLWERYILPLAGQRLLGEGGRTSTLLTADSSGVKRLTSNGRSQFIPIEVFKQAVARLIERGCVTRHEINQDYVGRASSGVVLVLSQVPLFEHLTKPSRLVLRKAHQS
ncbi:MAG: restriction endonuclease [Candidatus Sulfotelmatobacter sp.]